MKRWEKIIEASKEYANQHVHPIEWNKSYCDFKSGAEWADETLLDKICKWIDDNAFEYVKTDTVGIEIIYKGFDSEKMIKDLKKSII